MPLPVSQRQKQLGTNSQSSSAQQEVKQFASSLVDGVIKTVAETSTDNSTEITVTDTDKISVHCVQSGDEETVSSQDEGEEAEVCEVTTDVEVASTNDVTPTEI